MIVQGGKAVFGASVGILMLEARFPRIPGDMGNAVTWPFPVHYKVVRGASPDLVVRQGSPGLYERFLAAGKELVADGADGITTNCGFLSLYQAELARDLDVPVAASSLMQLPWIDALLPPGKRTGILTISASSLTAGHLKAAGLSPDVLVMGTENGQEFSRVILNNEPQMDVDLARKDNVDAALAFQQANPDLGAILLECTNMIPYAADIRAATGLPVFSIYNLITWFQASLVPRRFG